MKFSQWSPFLYQNHYITVCTSPSLLFIVRGQSDQTSFQSWEEGQPIDTITQTWQDSDSGLTGSQTITQTAGQPWQELATHEQQKKRTEDEWFALLHRYPPFPFFPPFDFVKQPGIFTYNTSQCHSQVAEPIIPEF